jgi:uncharacterized protein YejL (UPF0352 family)
MTESTTDHLGERLSDYLDGELSGRALREVEDHLGSCAECASLLAELRAVVAGARTLEPIPPRSDLWPGIAARLMDLPRRVIALPLHARGLERRFSLSIPQLAAASFLIAAISGGAVWLSLRSGPGTVSSTSTGPVAVSSQPGPLPGRATETPSTPTAPKPATEPVGRASPPPSLESPTASQAMFADYRSAQYDQAVAELQQVLERHRAELDPKTVRLVEANLATIDSAIAQARKALIADPSNPYLSGHLAEQMKRKVRVLQQAADAIAANVQEDTGQ